MKQCPRCSKEHEKSGIYCSRSCANVRIPTDAQKQKMSDSMKLVQAKVTPEQFKERTVKARVALLKKKEQKILDGKTEDLSPYLRKKKVLNEQNGVCLHCGISEWQGKPLTLELDHIDGNNQNNGRENLRILCPNCHSQTPTWKISGEAKRRLQTPL